MKTTLTIIVMILLLTTAAVAQLVTPQPYWTASRVWETTAVTALHAADAAQSCYNMAHGAIEEGLGTPHNCAGATAYLLASGPVLQWASYRMMRRHPGSRAWRVVDRTLPYVEISISINAMRCSAGRCDRYGF